MKHVLVIPDGAADEPQPELGGQTPLQAAEVPHMDRVAQSGMVGRADHVPLPMPSGSDVGTMSLFGYDPLADHTGRAPIEAAAQGITLDEGDWAVRCNLVTVENEVMRSFTAEQYPSPEGAALIKRLDELAQTRESSEPGRWSFHPGVSYRNIAVWRADGADAPFTSETRTTPPHDITDQQIGPHLPTGPGSDLLRDWMLRSRELFAEADENRKRTDAGELPASQVWLWGQGSRPALEPFTERYGKRAAVITAVDLLRGLGKLLGWRIVEVDGATGYLDTDYAAKGRAAIETLPDVDLMVVHVEATDEASHEGNAKAKVEALGEIDRHIVGPLLDHLQSNYADDWRMLVCPDHPTFLRTKTHSHGFVPFALAGTDIEIDAATTYDEVSAEEHGTTLDRGFHLMSHLLGTDTP